MKIAALDIGGTSIKAGIWEDGELSGLKEYDTDAKRGGQFVMEKAISIIREFEGFECIGISTAGQVDPVRGMITYANENIPGYTGMKIKEIMEKEFGVPTAVENDVNSAALGEAHYGAGRDYNDFLCATYGTGVGGAIIIDRKIYTGSGFSAGEFGSLVIHADKRIEGDLLSGCYERYASTTALVRNAREYDVELSNGRKIFERIEEPEVKMIVDNWINEISYGLTTLIHIFNPSCVVLGGGVLAQKYVVEKLNKVIYNNIMDSFKNVKLVQAELGNKAGLFGAVHCAKSIGGKA